MALPLGRTNRASRKLRECHLLCDEECYDISWAPSKDLVLPIWLNGQNRKVSREGLPEIKLER